MGKGLDKLLSKNIQLDTKHTNRCSTCLVIKETHQMHDTTSHTLHDGIKTKLKSPRKC